MKTFKTQSILLIYLSVTCGICANYSSGSLPDGCLLAISVVQIHDLKSDNVSVFKIDFNGTVTKFWDFSLTNSDTLNTLGLFAVDAKKELVYLGSRDKFLALDLMTGAVKIKIQLKPPNIQYFWSYDYVDDTVYGVCSGNAQWDWCRIKQTGSNAANIDFLYKMPFTTILSPTSDIYYIDSTEQTIWYYPFQATGLDEYAVGINYTTGEKVFKSGFNPSGTEDVCIVRDHELDRVFTYVVNYNDSAKNGIGELFPSKPKKMLKMLGGGAESNLKPISYGTCDYDQGTHTMIALMGSPTTDTPTKLLLVDVRNVKPTFIPLPEFKNWNNLSFTSFKFISKQL